MNIKSTFASIKNSIAAKTTGRKACKGALAVLSGSALAVGLCMPELAMAAPWDSTASSVLAMFTGGMARTIAIIAVIACGIAAVVGKLSWDWAIKIIIGIVLIFGATKFVDYIISTAS